MKDSRRNAGIIHSFLGIKIRFQKKLQKIRPYLLSIRLRVSRKFDVASGDSLVVILCVFTAGWLDLAIGLSFISLLVGCTWRQGLALFRCWSAGPAGRAYLVVENLIICVTM